MAHYLVVHDVTSFQQHGDWIGKEAETVPSDFRALRPGDGIVYYCKEDMVITGTFKVASAPRVVVDDVAWPGPHTVVKIGPVAKAEPPYFVSVKQMLGELPEPLSIFPDRRLSGIRLRGKTFIPITQQDFQAITDYVRTYTPKDLPFRGPANDAGLGQPGNFGAMNYAPTSEQGVVALFVWHMKGLGFEHLEFIRQGFPDACAIQATGKTYQKKYIEFEYRSSQFRQHVNDPKHREFRCDYVVCWVDDYPTCPVPVIQLKSEIDWVLPHQGRPTTVRSWPLAPTPKEPAMPDRMQEAKPAEAKPARTSPEFHDIEVRELLAQGKLVAGQGIRLDWKGQSFSATVQADGAIMFNGTAYSTPSSAGQAARNGLSTNGWAYWKFLEGETWVPLGRLRM